MAQKHGMGGDSFLHQLQAEPDSHLGRAEQIQTRVVELVAEGHRILTELSQLADELVGELRLAELRRVAVVNEQLPDLLGARQIAHRLSISERAVYVMMDEGAFGCIRHIGTRRLVSAQEYLRFLAGTGR